MKRLIFITLILLSSMISLAQTNTAIVNVTLNPVTNLSVSGGSTTLQPFDSGTNLETGIVTSPLTLEVKSNRPWQLTTAISNITTSIIAGGPTTITNGLQPSNIQWGTINGAGNTVTAFTPFVNATPVTSTVVVARTGTKGNVSITGNTFTLQYKIIPGLTVDPANYIINIAYTISEQ